MKIAFVASEAVPYAKTGGLADVIGSLPGHLADAGIDISVFIPRYKTITSGTPVDTFEVTLSETHYTVNIVQDGKFFFVDCPQFFDREGLYGTCHGDHPDNLERFTLFCKAVCTFIKDKHCDIIHCHDWQTGLIPLFLRDQQSSIKTVFTIHNLGYQGRFLKEKYPILNLDLSYFTMEGLEYFGDINCLKAGIVYSDVVTTVSENYAQEIQTPELGFGLDGILRTRKKDLFGIVNGINYKEWNPEKDNILFSRYRDWSGKGRNKNQLLHDCALCGNKPLIGMVSRIAAQKGFDILIKGFDEIMAHDLILIILGMGDEEYHKKLEVFQRLYPNRFFLNLKFDNKLAHRIYGASDFFLMPSRYEPCGLGQLISMRYGTVPIVRYTGGLADTVHEYDPGTGKGNGFGFRGYSCAELIETIQRGMNVYQDQARFRDLSESCMKMDFSWGESAKKYMKLYEKLLSK